MRVVVAVQGWPGVPGPGPWRGDVAASSVGEEWKAAAPHIEVVAVSIPDGGPRSADYFTGCLCDGSFSRANAVLAVPGPDDDVWLAPMEGHRWTPHGLGETLRARAAKGGTGTIVIPLGDAEPAGDATSLWGGDAAGMRAALAGFDIVALVGSPRPLLGFHGMSAAVRDGREADAALAVAAQEQEQRWAAIAREADALADGSMLLGPTRLSDFPGSGAAGGLAYCLAAVGARLLPASAFLVGATGLRGKCEGADLAVTIMGELTPRTLDHGIATAMAREAARSGVPATVLACGVGVGKRDLMAAGLASAHEAEPGEQGLRAGIRRLAATWTR